MDSIVELVLWPISLFSGKPLAVGIALTILISSFIIYMKIYFFNELPFLRNYRQLTRSILLIRKNGGTQEEQFASFLQVAQNTELEAGLQQYRSALEFVDGKVLSYADPAPFFAVERNSGHNYPKWASTLGGVFLTLGLFFTFVGLSAALLQVGGDGSKALDASQLREAVSAILGISAVKFITSLSGILAYIFWSIVARVQADAQDSVVDRFIESIRSLSIYMSPEIVLREQLKAIENQKQQFETFGNDLAVAIGHEIRQAFKTEFDPLPREVAAAVGPAVGDAIRPVRDELSSIAERIGSAGGSMAAGASDVFAKVWSEGIGAQMAAFGSQMTSTISALDNMVVKVRQTEDGLGGGIGSAAEELARVAGTMNKLFEENQKALSATLLDFSGKIQSLPEIIASVSMASVKDVGQTIKDSLGNITEVASVASRQTAEQLSSEVAKISNSLSSSADRLRTASDYSSAGIKTAHENIEKSVQNSVDMVTAAAVSSSDKLSETVSLLSNAVHTLAMRLGETEKVIAGNQNQLQTAGESVSDASTLLAQAAQSVKDATTPFANIASATKTALESVSSASRSLQISTEISERSVNSVQSATERVSEVFTDQAEQFSTLNRNVKETLSDLIREIAELGVGVSRVMETYDREIAKSIGSLESAVFDLADILETRQGQVKQSVNS